MAFSNIKKVNFRTFEVRSQAKAGFSEAVWNDRNNKKSPNLSYIEFWFYHNFCVYINPFWHFYNHTWWGGGKWALPPPIERAHMELLWGGDIIIWAYSLVHLMKRHFYNHIHEGGWVDSGHSHLKKKGIHWFIIRGWLNYSVFKANYHK